MIAVPNAMAALDSITEKAQLRVLVTRIDFGKRTLNGVALARMIRYRQPGVRVVFVARPEFFEVAAKEGGFLPAPPIDPKALVPALAQIVREAGAA